MAEWLLALRKKNLIYCLELVDHYNPNLLPQGEKELKTQKPFDATPSPLWGVPEGIKGQG